GRVTPLSVPMPLNPPPTRVFTLAVAGEEVRVEYYDEYFPRSGTDYFQYRSPHEPVRPTPLSETGWYSHYAHRDGVEACGGPKAYGGLYAAAKVEGRAEEFVAAFEGEWPTGQRRERVKTKPVVGRHTAEVVTDQPEIEGVGSLPDDTPPGRLF